MEVQGGLRGDGEGDLQSTEVSLGQVPQLTRGSGSLRLVEQYSGVGIDS